MSLESKIEQETRLRAKEAFDDFLTHRKGYAGEGQRVNLHKLIDACKAYMDRFEHSMHLGSATFKDVLFEAFLDSNMDYFKGKVEDDIYNGAMKRLEDNNG